MHEQDVVCEKCGSRYFQEASFSQYREGVYSSVPGGDFNQVSEQQQHLLICLCGHPRDARRLGQFSKVDELRSFEEAVNKARQYRSSLEGASLIVRIEEQFASKRDIHKLSERLRKTEVVMSVVEYEQKKDPSD